MGFVTLSGMIISISISSVISSRNQIKIISPAFSFEENRTTSYNFLDLAMLK